MVLELTAFQNTLHGEKAAKKNRQRCAKNPGGINFLLCLRAKQEKERLERRETPRKTGVPSSRREFPHERSLVREFTMLRLAQFWPKLQVYKQHSRFFGNDWY
jgi:hypothetical protein